MEKEERKNLNDNKMTSKKEMEAEFSREFATLGDYREALKEYYRESQRDDTNG